MVEMGVLCWMNKSNDLISRAAAIEAVRKEEEYFERSEDYDCAEAVQGARWSLEQVPIVDIAPVVHGKWVRVHGYATPGGDPVWKCSICGKGKHVYGIEHGSYGADIADGQWVSCPNCGAVMDGEEGGID